MNYYNEIEPFAVEWLKNLIREGLIADGIVDSRPIQEVNPGDLIEFKQCHFFAGIGGWSYALRLAGVPDDFPVWTGSCPCQPFSCANTNHGSAKGQKDERHLWPEFYRLISQSNPPIIFGEQVESAIRWGWLDEAFGNLEDSNYACASAVLPALSVGADHERKRLFWFAVSSGERRERYKHDDSLLGFEVSPSTIVSDTFSNGRSALEGNFSHLLSDDGVSLQVERCRTKGYGNAIVPQVAAEFIKASFDAIYGR